MKLKDRLGPFFTWLIGITLFSVSANTYFPKSELVRLHTDKAFYCNFQKSSDKEKVILSKPFVKSKSLNVNRSAEIIFKTSEQNDHKTLECLVKGNDFYKCEWTAYNYILVPMFGRKLAEAKRTGGEFVARWHRNAFDTHGEQVFCYQF